MERIIEKLRKVKRLADQGVGGERETARLLLAELMEKYGISRDQIDDEIPEEFRFSYRNITERNLINQVIASVSEVTRYFVQSQKYVTIDVVKAEGVLISQMIHFHLNQYRRELNRTIETLYLAYIHKHHIFPPKKKDQAGSDQVKKEKPDPDEVMRILNMINTLDDVTFRKAIG